MLRIDQVTKELHNFSLREITFTVKGNDYFLLLGPSGSGKSLLLQIISGLVKPDKGRIFVDGKEVTHAPVGKRNIGILFQHYALFPHLNVFDNIAYGLRRKSVSKHAITQRINELSDILSIGHLLNRPIHNLSGGEMQRVALARTLAPKPLVILLDEPLSAIDAKLHQELSSLLRQINRQGHIVVHVTHNFNEAISLAKHVAIINNGKIEQTGSALEVFQNPRSEFVASFTGAKNFFRVQQQEISSHGLVYGEIHPGLTIAYYTEQPSEKGYISFPESSVVLTSNIENQSALNVFNGRIIDIFARQQGYEVAIDCEIRIFAIVTYESLARLKLSPGNKIYAMVKANAVKFIPES